MKEVLKMIVATIVIGVLMVGMFTSTGLAEQYNISNPSTQNMQNEDIAPSAPQIDVQDKNTTPTAPSDVTIPSEPVPATGGSNTSLLWWLLLIPPALLLWLLFAMWFSVIPIAETVTDNGNGTFTVQWGYENRKPRKYKVGSDKSTISVITGRLIDNSANPPVEFKKGRVENVFTSVVDKDTAIEWRIKGRSAKVDITKLDK